MQQAGTGADPAQVLGEATRRRLRERIARSSARLRALPGAEQRRLFEQARAKSPTLFALLHKLQQDPDTGALVRRAVVRTREAPSEQELKRCIARGFASAFRAGALDFRAAGGFVLARLGEEFGEGNARRVQLSELQRAYLAAASRARHGRFDTAATVMSVAGVANLREALGASPEEWRTDVPVAVTAAPHAPPAAAATDQSERPTAQDVLATGMVAACLHIESGLRNLAEFTEAMTADFGEAARPHLRAFYEAIRHYPAVDLSGHNASFPGDDGLFGAMRNLPEPG